MQGGNELRNTLFKTDLRLEIDFVAGLASVADGNFNVGATQRNMLNVHTSARRLPQRRDNLKDGNSTTSRDVENAGIRQWPFNRSGKGAGSIRNVNEITGLRAVPMDHRLFARHQPVGEKPHDAAVR